MKADDCHSIKYNVKEELFFFDILEENELNTPSYIELKHLYASILSLYSCSKGM